MTSKYNGSKIPLKLKSQILEEIFLPDSFIPKIAKKYNLSSTTLYGWRSYHRKLNGESKIVGIKNNFIELVSEKSGSKSSLSLPAISKSQDPKLSEISLIVNNISLSIRGNIGTSSLVKILGALGEESC